MHPAFQRRFTLRFTDAAREQEFAAHYLASSLRTNRASLLLALALFAAFAPLDRLLAPAALTAIWSIRAAVCVVLAAAFTATLARLSPRRMQALLASQIVFMGAGIIAMTILSREEHWTYYYGALIPVILFAHGMVRLRFAVATAWSWLITLVYVAMASSIGAQPEVLASQFFLLGTANLMGMLTSGSRESWARTAFEQRRKLQEAGRELKNGLDRERRLTGTLEASEQRVRGLLDAMNEGLVAVRPDGVITWLNRSLCRMTGYEPHEVIGRHPGEFLDEANRRVFEREFGSRQAGVDRRYEVEWIRKDGSRLSSLVSPHPMFSDPDQFAGSVSVISDITALKQAEERLALSERQFRELVDHASSIILRWDADGTIRFINPFGLRFLGYTGEELIGRNVIGTIVPETDSGGRDLVEMIRDITVHPERYMFNENEVCDRSGRRFWVVWTNRALTDAHGRITEVLSIGTDITEVKRAREELARQRDELAQMNDFIRGIFGRYLSEAVVRSLLDSPENLKVGGARQTISVLIADVRGFAAICEDLEAEQVVALLNGFLESMTGIIERYEGTIDEIMGDGMLVLFGAPIWKPDHAERAVTCALAMQRGMDDVNRRSRTNGLPVIEMGIGIATGEVIVGNIGSLRRAKYGVVGTTVNLASRIEAYTVGGQILISDTTAAEAGRSLILGDSIRVEPKGAREPITLREVRGIDGRADLTLPPPPASPLPQPLHVRCTCNVVDDKFTTGPGFAGHIRPLSQREADLQCDVSLPPLTDLRIRFIDEAGVEMAGDVYAKVTGQPGPEHYRVRFTSVPPAARRFVAKRARSPKRADSRRVPQPAASGTDTALEHGPIDASDGVLKGERALA